MKEKLMFVLVLFHIIPMVVFGQVGIGTANVDNSAILQMESTNKGLLVPRITGSQRKAIQDPADALLIFNKTSHCYEGYSKADGKWYSFACLTVDGKEYVPWSEDYVHCSVETEVVDVTSLTGKVWMDRNLGASRVATSSTDTEAYGDYYQWGRLADGHQCTTSEDTNTRSTTDVPGHSKFIIHGAGAPYDWRNPQNINLWQGVNGINNPCPSGYRIPTYTEWQEEANSWSTKDAAGAFNSPLKLTLGGSRNASNNYLDKGVRGYYHSSDSYYVSFYNAYFNESLQIDQTNTKRFRFTGESVRCIKDY